VVLTVDVDISVGIVPAVFIADVTLYHLRVVFRHVHKRQVIQQAAESPRVTL